MDYAVGNNTIRLFLGDITTLKVDAIVNSANSDLWMGSGVARAIAQAGGETIEKEARKHAPCPIGTVIVTNAGKLKVKYVLHAVVMEQDLMTDQKKITAAAQAAVAKAEAMKLSSIAIPALGVGVGLFSSDMIAKVLVDIAHGALAKTQFLKTIVFSLVNEEIYRAFERALPPAF